MAEKLPDQATSIFMLTELVINCSQLLREWGTPCRHQLKEEAFSKQCVRSVQSKMLAMISSDRLVSWDCQLISKCLSKPDREDTVSGAFPNTQKNVFDPHTVSEH